MSTPAELVQEAIATSALTGIASASNDSGSMTTMPIGDQIKAAQFLAARNASSKAHFGLRFTKLIPPGCG